MPTPSMDAPRGSSGTQDSRLDPETRARLDRIWANAYRARTKEDLRNLYAEWAETYDRDHRSIGFFGHRLAAEVLSRHTTRHDVARVLDAGAGTGAGGEALQALGFRNLSAVDLVPEMLERAREKDLYRETVVADISFPVDVFPEESFDAALLVGVFSYGQAPAEALDEMLRLVRPGGVVVFTVRTDFLEEDAMGFRTKVRRLESAGSWNLLECTDAYPYLPNKDPDAMFRVFCYRVTGQPREETEDGFEAAVRAAFQGEEYVKALDHVWIWDSTASRLYERYTRTEGYYLTDCEAEILRANASEIWNGERLLVELGCGSAEKIRHVLHAAVDRSDSIVTYLPIDVSPGALRATTAQVRRVFGDRIVLAPRQGLVEEILPLIPGDQAKLIFFFGSSIGNLPSLEETVRFLRRVRRRLRPGDRFVVGTDLHKRKEVLDRAYNEEEACRSFFVHMLRRINEHLGADFDPRVFELASTDEEDLPYRGIHSRRIDLRIAPRVRQDTYIRKLDLEVHLEPGQPVQVGVSRKFEVEEFGRLARLAGFHPERSWLDARGWFALNELIPTDGQ